MKKMKKCKNLNFIDILSELTTELLNKIYSVSPKTLVEHPIGKKFNHNYYCINPHPLLSHIYRDIEDKRLFK